MEDRAGVIRAAAVVVVGLLVAGGLGLVLRKDPTVRPVPAQLAASTPVLRTPPVVPPAPPLPVEAVALTGCPPPPRPPGPPPPTPWHPAVLVPESALPVPPKPAPHLAAPAVLAGKGMWIWQPARTEHGNVAAIVDRAVAAGLTELWVRVGDSRNGFYGASFLASLVPLAHERGLAVIGWGFPYLYDPVGDAGWTAAALAWRAPNGDRIDGWSADIETASEGTALSARRASTYLGLVRPSAGKRPLVATVYPPTDYWLTNYPFQDMAPFVDAFSPMIYWSCREPGDAASAAIHRLSALAPVHLIGQAYDMGPDGGRVGHPSPAEIARFLDVARRGGATGASFWDWQEMSADEWAALSAYPWLGRVSGTVVATPA